MSSAPIEAERSEQEVVKAAHWASKAEHQKLVWKFLRRSWLGFGIILLLLAISLELATNKEAKDVIHFAIKLVTILIAEIGFAVLIACLIAYLFDSFRNYFETLEHEERLDEIKANVFKYLLGRAVDERVVAELLKTVFEARFFRKNLQLEYEFRPLPRKVRREADGDKLLLVQVRVRYELHNVTSEREKYTINASFENVIEVEDFPDSFKTLEVKGAENEIRLGERELRPLVKVLKDTAVSQQIEVRDVIVSRERPVEVQYTYEVVRRYSDAETWVSHLPADDLSIRAQITDPQIEDLKLWAVGSHRKDPEPIMGMPTDNARQYGWRINAAVLPYQGVTLYWCPESIADHFRRRVTPEAVSPAATTHPHSSGSGAIKVGVLHSLTGTMAISERSVVDATLLAIEEINEQGGVLGHYVEPVVKDGRSDWPTFAKCATQLIHDEGVSCIFGCWTSASRKTVEPVLRERDHLLFYPVQYEGLEQSPHIVYTGAAPNQQIIPGVEWMCRKLGKKRLFLVGSDYVFPRTANEIVRHVANSLGAEIVGESYLSLGSTDVRNVIHTIADSQADMIVNTINGDTNVPFFRGLREAGMTPRQLPTLSFSISEVELESLDVDDIVGDYAAWNYFQSIDRPENLEFVKKFRSKYGSQRVVSDPMEAAYVGVHLWARAVAAAGSDNPRSVRAAVKDQVFQAPEGPVRVDAATQHTWKTARVGVIKENGRFQIVHSSEAPIQPLPYPSWRTKEEWDAFLADLKAKWHGQWAKPESASIAPTTENGRNVEPSGLA